MSVWDVATAAPVTTWRFPGRVRRLVFTADGARAYVAADRAIYAWDVAAAKVVAQVALGATAWDVALLDGGRVVASLDDGHQAALWDADTLAPHAGLRPFPDRLRQLVVAGDRLVVTTDADVLIVDAGGGVHGRADQEAGFAAAVAGPRLAIGTPVGEITLRDTADASLIRRWRSAEGVMALAFRPDGALLATASGRRVRMWDPATGRELFATPELPALITQLAWSPDGEQLAAAGGTGVVYLWDLAAPRGPVADRARCVSPWRLDGSGLAIAALDPTWCAGQLAP